MTFVCVSLSLSVCVCVCVVSVCVWCVCVCVCVWLCVVCVLDVSLSCRNRCYEPLDVDSESCRCDSQCVETHSCCFDYKDICLLPSECH